MNLCNYFAKIESRTPDSLQAVSLDTHHNLNFEMKFCEDMAVSAPILRVWIILMDFRTSTILANEPSFINFAFCVYCFGPSLALSKRCILRDPLLFQSYFCTNATFPKVDTYSHQTQKVSNWNNSFWLQAYRFRFVICEILFSAKFRYLKFSSLKKQASIWINSQPTTSRDSKECPTASMPLKVAVVVEMRLNSIKLCVFERDLNESIGTKAISILAKVPI